MILTGSRVFVVPHGVLLGLNFETLLEPGRARPGASRAGGLCGDRRWPVPVIRMRLGMPAGSGGSGSLQTGDPTHHVGFIRLFIRDALACAAIELAICARHLRVRYGIVAAAQYFCCAATSIVSRMPWIRPSAVGR